MSSLRPLSTSRMLANWSEDHQNGWEAEELYGQERLKLGCPRKRKEKAKRETVSFSYRVRGYGEDGAKLSSELHSKTRMCNNCKVQQGQRCMNIGNRLPRKAFRSPSLNIKLLQRCSWATCSERDIRQDDFQGPFQPRLFHPISSGIPVGLCRLL